VNMVRLVKPIRFYTKRQRKELVVKMQRAKSKAKKAKEKKEPEKR
jgi:hypothetical protein